MLVYSVNVILPSSCRGLSLDLVSCVAHEKLDFESAETHRTNDLIYSMITHTAVRACFKGLKAFLQSQLRMEKLSSFYKYEELTFYLSYFC